MVCAVMCVGCSFNSAEEDEKPIQFTISLTEAESAIFNALQINAGQINRDPFQKWGAFEFSYGVRVINPDSNELLGSQRESAFATCENGVYENEYLTYEYNDFRYDEHSIREYYTVGNIQYTYENSSVHADNVDKEELLPETDIIKNLFADDSLYLVYGNKVTKEVTTGGYTLVFRSGLQGVVNYLCIMRNEDIKEHAESYLAQLEAMYSNADLSEASVQLLIKFDKQNNITEIKFNYVSFDPSQYMKSESEFVAKKSTSNIPVPEWYLDYLGEK